MAPRRGRESTIQSPPGDQRTKPERDTSEYTKHGTVPPREASETADFM